MEKVKRGLAVIVVALLLILQLVVIIEFASGNSYCGFILLFEFSLIIANDIVRDWRY